MSELDIFTGAVVLTDPAARAAFLDQACWANAALRARVESLLARHESADSFLEDSPADLLRDAPAAPTWRGGRKPAPDPATAPGAVIAGRYALVRLIGEGGMGAVYLAGQTEPVKRQVALKLIRAGADSRTVLARFDAERQALALMDHPNIARMYDGGLTPAGRPFFVMELVDGVPLTDYCDRHRLTVEARLALFVQVCQAVQHAHQKGIIHRDLKPSNVLVAEVDGRPTPKVIDFGVAKATERSLTDLSLSDAGAVVGTPAYMSPEQADPYSVDIDTRADVYALGVMLYELLTGSPPLGATGFDRGAFLEVLRLVREVEPPRPSTRLSTADALPSIAANRSTEPAKLAKLLRGELDWVVMKALEKDRARRYESANALAADVRRYLADEMVEARPPSRSYRLKKLVKRNKVQVLAAALIVFALVAGLAGTTVGLVEARRQAEAAESERTKAVAAATAERRAKEEADDRRRAAETNLGYARKANDILGEVFTGLDPGANYATVAEFRAALRANLGNVAAALNAADIGDPLASAGLHERLGLSLLAVGDAASARPRFEKAVALRTERLGADHPDTLKAASNLAFARKATNGPVAALPLFEDLLARRTLTLGADHPDTVTARNNLGVACQEVGQTARAAELFEAVYAQRVAALGAGHADTLATLNNLATAHATLGAYDRAVALHRKAHEASKAIRGADHVETLKLLSNLGSTLQLAGRTEEAVRVNEQVLPVRRKVIGSDHPDTLTTMANLGYGYHLQKKYDLALPLLEEALRGREAVLGKDHRDTLSGVNNLALAYSGNGQADKAVPLFERAAERMTATLGADHPDTLAAQANLASAYRQTGRVEKAIPLLERGLERQGAALGKDHPSVLTTMTGLANAYKVAGRHDKAIPLYQSALERRKAAQGDSHPDTVASIGNLGAGYAAAGRHAEAVATLEQFVAAQRKQLPPARLAALLTLVGPELGRCGRPDLHEAYLREAVATYETSEPGGWRAAGARAQLGGLLLAQKKYADAEPLLVKGYEGLKAKENEIPRASAARLPETLDRLIELFTATKKPDDVEKWRRERAKYAVPKPSATSPKEEK
ncbi:Serine/threonine-protein kinase PknB [Gemmata obscuriglobus]|uniref:Tetratricopeptide repeat protein n=1 Tax=Gemmata obscuriglobus TaxID=114 RepID=A0A2Z3GT10_9BACT|nr:serine/threonine-protein kinase [Gemmata obscuriglobus]AWM36408.1 tetratricopeptide repeat protein [Gemmata obscuriglobus]QEG30977.1 Serine/threonine-protein kinase PknB [Gemmata obscuriglobus]VTS10312.1 serine threonine protein kinase : Putative serine/threonine protein kinase OS=Gemmata sp. Wa1-1 PE=3 SV=1: Pkinase: TPR_12: TPR_10: TPR_10: TPR_12: TPR_12: TPR_12 [Gemmata obscuriglobus UQM 2246]